MRIVLYGNGEISYCSEVHHQRSLQALGHDVEIVQENKVATEVFLEKALAADLAIWVHSHGFRNPGALPMDRVLRMLKAAGIPTLSYHLDLFFGINRWREYKNSPLWEIEHFFSPDQPMVEWLNENSAVKAHFLPAGVLADECYISTEPSPHANDVIFVGSRNYHHEHPWRPQLIDWLRQSYGRRFTHIGGDGDTGTLRGDALNRAYANSKVAVGDTLCIGFNYPDYHSDRLFECPGRGGFSLFPRIPGIDKWFTDRENIAFYDYNNFGQLRALIDYYVSHNEERERIRRAGHELVKAHHTYRHRWQTILDTVFS